MSSVLDEAVIAVGDGMVPITAVWRWSVDQYHAMIDRGILHSGDPAELLDGLVVLKNTPTITMWRFSLDQYHAMIESGILHSGDPAEFLEGVVAPKMTRSPPHRIALAHLRDLLVTLVGPAWHVESQEAISLETSEPEPDVAVVRGRVDDYPDRNPGPADLGLVVEVSEISLPADRGLKKRIYAGASIVEYWIVNLVDRQIEVYSDPTGPSQQPDYRERLVFTPGETVPLKLNSFEMGSIAVSQVLPA